MTNMYQTPRSILVDSCWIKDLNQLFPIMCTRCSPLLFPAGMFDLVRETVSLCQGTNQSPFRFFGDHNRCSALLVQHRTEIALLFALFGLYMQYNFIERVRGFPQPGSDNQQDNRDSRHCRHGLSAIPLLLSCETLVLQYAAVSLSRISITLSLLSLILVTSSRVEVTESSTNKQHTFSGMPVSATPAKPARTKSSKRECTGSLASCSGKRNLIGVLSELHCLSTTNCALRH